jgi:hypothetical protein
MAMSRRCIPYTPRRLELRESTFALVSTAGVHLRNQEPYALPLYLLLKRQRKSLFWRVAQ